MEFFEAFWSLPRIMKLYNVHTRMYSYLMMRENSYRQSENLQYYFFLTALLFLCVSSLLVQLFPVRISSIYFYYPMQQSFHYYRTTLVSRLHASGQYSCMYNNAEFCKSNHTSIQNVNVIPIWCMFFIRYNLISSVFSSIILYELSQLEHVRVCSLLYSYLFVEENLFGLIRCTVYCRALQTYSAGLTRPFGTFPLQFGYFRLTLKFIS